MKRILFYLLFIAVALSAGLIQSITQAADQQQSATAIIPAPSSLDAYFPPAADQPLYLFKMLALNKPFTGMIADLLEQDFPGVQTDFETFKNQYAEMSGMVPEWESHFPLKPIDDLQAALAGSSEPNKIMPAIEAVGRVCSDCHQATMPTVQQKYYWGNFQDIKINDPLMNQQISNQQLMQFIDANFTGIEVNIEQGQIENAQKQFQAFRARFEAMEETCMNCHETERHYYVDEEVKAMIDKLDQALLSSPVDPNAIAQLHQAIGMESCFKCHLVHIPAAIAQAQQAVNLLSESTTGKK